MNELQQIKAREEMDAARSDAIYGLIQNGLKPDHAALAVAIIAECISDYAGTKWCEECAQEITNYLLNNREDLDGGGWSDVSDDGDDDLSGPES